MDDKAIGSFAKFSLQDALSKRFETLGTNAPDKDARDRQRVAQEFSSFLFLEVLKSMRAALPQEGFGENESLSRDLYTNMMDAEIARVMAKRDSTGLTRAVEKSLDKLAPRPQAASEAQNPTQGVVSSPFGARIDPIDGQEKFHQGVDIAAPTGTPVKSVEKSLDKLAPRPQAASEAQNPTQGVVSSPFGARIDPINGQEKFHQGVDIAAPTGTPVKAAAAGKVVFAGHKPGFGNFIEVEHGNGLVTRYGHNSANLVTAGQEIQAGQAIALVGATGRATGSHLHFEVRQAGKPVDPATLLGDLSKGARLSSVI